ncbi:Crp/Fnr family transcriptional regulator [Sulfurirhabdus autotrophica]|uniref:Crp/Fnr family transcriptional regulator n=1 Tax=Sulfurirhabdus autotrophica TaxID=1706046 RepID=A0A4R3YCB6_9PROT|nr:Crp/Fnr family transcriptional regulator [Sulfurirhabdus autotrophica]TCV90085.1 hypothetical protein EDC63_10150 [Sulfurirhabdus autotrophica]
MSDDKKLSKLFRSLPDAQRQTLLAFAEFLAARGQEGVVKEIPQVNPIPRPSEESVIRAIKRLRATYPMLESGKLLNETSSAMTQHAMHGKPAVEVIDQLEVVFKSHYERYLGEQ